MRGNPDAISSARPARLRRLPMADEGSTVPKSCAREVSCAAIMPAIDSAKAINRSTVPRATPTSSSAATRPASGLTGAGGAKGATTAVRENAPISLIRVGISRSAKSGKEEHDTTDAHEDRQELVHLPRMPDPAMPRPPRSCGDGAENCRRCRRTDFLVGDDGVRKPACGENLLKKATSTRGGDDCRVVPVLGCASDPICEAERKLLEKLRWQCDVATPARAVELMLLEGRLPFRSQLQERERPVGTLQLGGDLAREPMADVLRDVGGVKAPISRRSAIASRMTGRFLTDTRSARSRRRTARSNSGWTFVGTSSSRRRRFATDFSGEDTLVKASSSFWSSFKPRRLEKFDLMTSRRCVARTSPGVTMVSPMRSAAVPAGIHRARRAVNRLLDDAAGDLIR